MRRYFPLLFLAVGLGWALPLAEPRAIAQVRAAATGQRVVYLASGLSPEGVIALSANVAAGDEKAVVLLDVPKSRTYLKAFLKAYQPSQVVLAAASPQGAGDLGGALEGARVTPLSWQGATPPGLWKSLFARADEVVVCAAQPRGRLLQAACLAGAARMPLFVLEGRPQEEQELARRLAEWGTKKVHAVGDDAARVVGQANGREVRLLPDEAAVAAAHRKLLAKKGPVQALVVANPADVATDLGGMSSLAAWVALQRRGALLLTDATGKNTAALVAAAQKDPALAGAENLILVAGLKAIPMERRPNPLAGKDEFIELEPPAPAEGAPFTFATGRLFHDEPGVVALMLARGRLLAEADGKRPPRALVVSNPGGGLPLLETISHHTAKELRNAGFETTAMLGRGVKQEDIRRLLPQQDLFLWEGHHSTLVSDYGIPEYPEPLSPSLVFLQSCLALKEAEAHPFLRRGAVGVVGSPSRTYSATGGAISLAYFDALAYDRRSVGASLRQAKNFLLAFSRLKEQRLKDKAKLGGASLRSAWAFTLWGDPTVRLPAPQPGPDALPAVRAAVKGKRVTLTVPDKPYEEVKTDKYLAQMWPNARLAGYLTKADDEERKRLLPLLFAEVNFPGKANAKAPQLSSKLADDRWVFTWDERRGAGYLLVLPGMKRRGPIYFDVEWPG